MLKYSPGHVPIYDQKKSAKVIDARDSSFAKDQNVSQVLFSYKDKLLTPYLEHSRALFCSNCLLQPQQLHNHPHNASGYLNNISAHAAAS